MSFFDEVETTVANTRFLQASTQIHTVELKLTPFEELKSEEPAIRDAITIEKLLKFKTTGYYLFKQYLLNDKKEEYVALLDALDYYRRSRLHERILIARKISDQHLSSSTAGDAKDVRDESRIRKPPAATPDGERVAHNGIPKDPSAYKTLAKLFEEAKSGAVIGGVRKEAKEAPLELYDPLLDVLATHLQPELDKFLQSDYYKEYVQLEVYAQKEITKRDFKDFRPLGRGAFGAVSAVQKHDTGAIFAMKKMGKKQVKHSQSEWMVNNERKVLSKMKSPFVLSLNYSFQDDQSLYLVFAMCAGGDLKYHLRRSHEEDSKDAEFGPDRALFYAAEVLLGLEHIHSFNIVYRDLKPNNILLNSEGHCVISDLGLTIKLRRNKVLKHLAGTAGYWAPEIVQKTGTFKTSDFWSFGVFLYEMLCGKRPKCKCKKRTLEWCPFGQKRVMEENALLEKNILQISVDYPEKYFTREAQDILERLFERDPDKRLGAGGADEIKKHPYFASINWKDMLNLEVPPPYIPDQLKVHANSIGQVGEFNKGNFNKIKITDEDHKNYKDFAFVNADKIQEELEDALFKRDNPPDEKPRNDVEEDGCCVIL